MISQSNPHNQLADQQNSSSIILLRHAQSEQNKAKKQIFEFLSSQDHKISKQQLNDHPDYLSIKYASKFLDAGLSQLGQQQAIVAGEKIREKWGNDIGGVVVSPLRRALQTAEKVLSGVQGVTVWVEPLLTEALHAACDIGSNITTLIARYGSTYNFDALEKSKWQNWSIQIMQNEQLKMKIYKTAQDEKKDIYSVALEQMKNNKTLQTCEETRKRVKKLKQKLKEYKQRIQKTKKLLIIGHYFMIKYLTCSKYKENDGMPENGIELWNAEATEVNSQFLYYD